MQLLNAHQLAIKVMEMRKAQVAFYQVSDDQSVSTRKKVELQNIRRSLEKHVDHAVEEICNADPTELNSLELAGNTIRQAGTKIKQVYIDVCTNSPAFEKLLQSMQLLQEAHRLITGKEIII